MVPILFSMQEALIKEKYKAAIEGLSRTNNMDMGVAYDMLISNYNCLKSRNIKEIKPCGEMVDFVELGVDLAQLDKYRRK